MVKTSGICYRGHGTSSFLPSTGVVEMRSCVLNETRSCDITNPGKPLPWGLPDEVILHFTKRHVPQPDGLTVRERESN